MLNEIKNFNIDRLDMDELIDLAAMGSLLQEKFTSMGVEAPEWLAENLETIHREIKAKNRDRIASKIKAAKSRLETLRTPDEKRNSLQTAIELLEKQLAGA